MEFAVATLQIKNNMRRTMIDLRQLGVLACITASGCFGLAATTQAAPLFLFTGQSGAQTQIDVDHTTEWQVAPTVNFDLAGGQLDMKDGSQTGGDTSPTGDLFLSVYEDGGIIPVAQIDMTNADFVAAHTSSGDQAFNGNNLFTPVLFATPFTLVAGHSYVIDLTSPEADQQSHAYFIKGFDTSFIGDSSGNPVPVGNLDVPEPLSLTLLATGLVGVSIARRRRVRR
jgi:hypothetical protein